MINMKKFHVLYLDFNSKKVKQYDVLPYFRNCWKDKIYKKEVQEIKESKSFKKLNDWIISKSRYMFWARCEYEFLIAPWPFGCKQMYDDLKIFLPVYNIGDWDHDTKFCNIITRSMEKIDIHEQIMMNIDVITEILFNEFVQ